MNSDVPKDDSDTKRKVLGASAQSVQSSFRSAAPRGSPDAGPQFITQTLLSGSNAASASGSALGQSLTTLHPLAGLVVFRLLLGLWLLGWQSEQRPVMVAL